MDVHGNLNLNNNYLTGAVLGQENFPVNPKVGRFLMKGTSVYFCISTEDGLPVWVPFIKQLSLLRYYQTETALEWVINHNLNCNFPTVQVYDADGLVVSPDSIDGGTFNRVVITFTVPTSGVAIIQRGEEEGAPPEVYAFEQTFSASSTWVVTHNLGYYPAFRVIVGGNEVQPANVEQNSLNQFTVTFTSPESGEVRCV